MTPLARAVRFLSKPQLRARPLRFIARRATYEACRRVAPARLQGVRRAWLWPGDVEAFVPLGGNVADSLYRDGVHEPLSSTVFKDAINPHTVAVDVGAQYGEFALVAARATGATVLAVEPEPTARHLLERSVAHNGLMNVRVLSCALSYETGTAKLYRASDPWNPGGASLLDHMAGQQQDFVVVDVLRLDDVTDGPVSVLKIDVEGSEENVLRGATRALERDLAAVIVEVNDVDDANRSPTLELLRRAGYEIYGLGGRPSRVVLTPIGDDPRDSREPWLALNLVGLHPRSAAADALRAKGHQIAPCRHRARTGLTRRRRWSDRAPTG